jgi:hypothetical protein
MRSYASFNGQGGIRTLDTPKRILVFETSAFSRSATCPDKASYQEEDCIAAMSPWASSVPMRNLPPDFN